MCVTEPPCPLFHPEKAEIFPLHPPVSLRLHPALIRPCSHAGKMTERGKRERRGRGRQEKEMTAPQQVWRIGEEGEGGRVEIATLMMSFSPWEEEETYAASRGTRAG